jgi:hypothetical protein
MLRAISGTGPDASRKYELLSDKKGNRNALCANCSLPKLCRPASSRIPGHQNN